MPAKFVGTPRLDVICSPFSHHLHCHGFVASTQGLVGYAWIALLLITQVGSGKTTDNSTGFSFEQGHDHVREFLSWSVTRGRKTCPQFKLVQGIIGSGRMLSEPRRIKMSKYRHRDDFAVRYLKCRTWLPRFYIDDVFVFGAAD